MIFVWAAPASAVTEPQEEVVDLQLRWHHQFQFAGYYAALEKGFYREEGLTVKLHAGDSDHQPVPEVLAGRAQYAVGDSEVLYQRLLGKPLVALAAVFQHSPLVLLTRQDSGIYSVHDLIGKKVMLMNTSTDGAFLIMLRNEGVSLSQVQVIPSSYQLDDLISGKADAFNSYLTNEPYFLQQHNIAYNVITPGNYRIDFYSDVLFTSETELRSHPQRVAALRRATLKGWRYAMDHQDEIIDLLLNKYRVNKTRWHLEFEAAEMRKLIFPDLIEIGHMNRERWQHMADSFVEAGLIKSATALDGFIYDTSPKQMPEWVAPVLISLFIVAAGVLLIACYLFRLNVRLANAKNSLRKSEERLRLALGTAKQGWFDLNVQTGEILVSDEYAKILGYEPAELHTDLSEWQSKLHPDDREAVLKAFNECLGNGGPVTMEYRRAKKDGGWVWLSSIGKITAWDSSRRPFRMIGIHTDITVRKLAEEAAIASESRFRILFESTRDALVVFTSDGVCRDGNPAAVEMFECGDVAELRTKSPVSVSPEFQPDGRRSDEKAAAMIRLAMDNGSHSFEWTHRRKNGSEFTVDVVVTRIQLNDETLLVSNERDISERKQAYIKLQLAANVFTYAREGIFITDAAGAIVDVNDTFTHITGYRREEVLGLNPRILQSGRQEPEFYAAMWKTLLEKDHWYGEVWNRRKSGEVYAEMLTISSVRDALNRTTNYVALFTDITPIKKHQQQLEHIAHYDPLTGLPNRVLLADRLQQAMIQSERRNQSLAVAYLDLDGFKAVNDSHGHEFGDELLIAVSQRMKDALREGDTLARIGGDEFVAVLADLEQITDCEPVLARLLQAAADPVVLENITLNISASIGVTLYPQDGADADQLLRHADQAMYVAKQKGKNRYHLFDVNQDAAVKIQRENLEHIRVALDQRQFVLYYQPKINMKTGAVIGAEALIRWLHPERGLLLPADFLPVIENHHISVELGEWVIDAALTQMDEWHAAGLDIPVSVNVGARQLQQQDFMTKLSALLARHPGVQPCCLELEVLETSALEDVVQVSGVIQACRNLGVRFALDDFGTGFSSLTYLRRLPADMLKIDQSFVRDMLDDSDDMAIVSGIIGLAASFRRQVIAEGVETVAHGTQLLAMECVLAQGYGIARPMPAAELPGWVSSWKPDAAWRL